MGCQAGHACSGGAGFVHSDFEMLPDIDVARSSRLLDRSVYGPEDSCGLERELWEA